MPSPLHAFGSTHIKKPYEGRINGHKRKRFKLQTRELPKAPGVYFFYGQNERLLYVGKAKCLRERVRSYFADTSLPRPNKIKRLLVEIERMEVQQVGSELEALLLERRLIAERQPILNRQHKRFDVYPYLLLSDEAFPRLTITRAEPVEGEQDSETRAILREAAEGMKRDSRPLETPRAGEVSGRYLGPFTTPRHAYWALEAVVKLFPLRLCEDKIEVDPNGRGCFYRELGRCSGPCIGQTSREDYQKICDDLVHLLQTGSAPQIEQLKARMDRYAEDWKFEEAQRIKLELEAIDLVAARLRRLERMRQQNNAVIAQPGLATENGPTTALFLVRGGAVRRHLVIGNSPEEWRLGRAVIKEVFEPHEDVAHYTAKTELDEMMIIDRWLRSHGDEPCVVWMGAENKANRQWLSNATRQLRNSMVTGI
ncbi:hypothetical protein EON83_05735 [bacterium]|nr:MAG: hypothetical protein EON83_05735 [bacterium]